MALSKIIENSLADSAVSSAKLKDFAAAVDLNGVELVLDADADTSITADTDDRIDFKIANVEHFSFSNSSGDTIIKPMVDAKDIKFQQYDGRTLLDINDGGFIGIANGATGAGAIRIFEDTDNGSNYVGLTAGSISSSLTFTLPTADGSSGQFLKTDGSGALSFDTVSSAADDITTGDAAVTLATSAGNITIDAQGGDTDIIFKGTDSSSDITALTLDMSDAGKAIFNNAITSGAVITSGAGLVIADAGNIGSASDTDAIAIGSDGDVTLTQDLELQHDGAILSFGANDEVTLTHVHDTGILLNSTNVIQFNDASQNIGAPSATVLDINATDEVELNATLVDVNANLDVSGTYTGAGLMTTGGNIVIPDTGNIGSASDTDAIAIAANGVTTFSQAPVLSGASISAGTTPLTALDIDGGTDIGAAIVDADLFIIDDGAGGTNRKVAASRIKTYVGSLPGIDDQSSSNDDQLTITDSIVVINEDSDDVDFRVESNAKTHHFFLDGGTNDGAAAFNDDAPETGTGGVTLNQTSLDNNILVLKSNDIAHGVTNHLETDSYMGFLKFHATSGGGNITGISEDDVGMFIHGFAPSPNTTQNTTGVAVVMTRANDVSGAGGANVADGANIFGCQNGGNLQFLIRGDGAVFSNETSSTYDTFEDAQLVRAFDLSHGKGVIDSKFDKFVSYNHEKLAELDLVGREDDGTPNHFINVTGMQRLHNGAIWQQYEKHNQLLEAVYELAKEAVGEEKANAILEKHEVKRLQ